MTTAQRDLHQQLRAESLETRQRLAELLRPLDGASVHVTRHAGQIERVISKL